MNFATSQKGNDSKGDVLDFSGAVYNFGGNVGGGVLGGTLYNVDGGVGDGFSDGNSYNVVGTIGFLFLGYLKTLSTSPLLWSEISKIRVIQDS